MIYPAIDDSESNGGGSGDVTSVNGKTGVVVLTAVDVGAIPDAPNDGKTYGRNNAAWVQVQDGVEGSYLPATTVIDVSTVSNSTNFTTALKYNNRDVLATGDYGIGGNGPNLVDIDVLQPSGVSTIAGGTVGDKPFTSGVMLTIKRGGTGIGSIIAAQTGAHNIVHRYQSAGVWSDWATFVTDKNIDTYLSSYMKVGDYGFGGKAPALPVGTDFLSTLVTGATQTFTLSGTYLNAPLSGGITGICTITRRLYDAVASVAVTVFLASGTYDAVYTPASTEIIWNKRIYNTDISDYVTNGLSAYELAESDGFSGTVQQWLASLKGEKGDDGDGGLSAYQLAVNSGFTGTQAQWLTSLKGSAGVGLNPLLPSPAAYSLATAYQMPDLTVPYFLSVMIESAYTITLASTQNDVVELRIGNDATVATGGGVVAASWRASLTGIALSVGMGMVDRGQLSAIIPKGAYFAIRRTSGTNANIQSSNITKMT